MKHFPVFRQPILLNVFRTETSENATRELLDTNNQLHGDIYYINLENTLLTSIENDRQLTVRFLLVRVTGFQGQ